ncbi:MAG: hypothetical protein AAF228_13700 [Pseudomonadota bacterium]
MIDPNFLVPLAIAILAVCFLVNEFARRSKIRDLERDLEEIKGVQRRLEEVKAALKEHKEGGV